MLTLDHRDTPTTLALSYPSDPLGWWTPDRRAVAETVAADLSARVDAPGYDVWRVDLRSDPHTPVIAYATGIDGWGYVAVGPAIVTVDLPTVLRHEMVHSLGVLEHATDPAAVLWPYIAPGEVRDWTAADDELMRQGGLIVVECGTPEKVPTGAGGGNAANGSVNRDNPGTPPPRSDDDDDHPYTVSNPYTGPLVGVPFAGGWALVPPRVAEAWGH